MGWLVVGPTGSFGGTWQDLGKAALLVQAVHRQQRCGAMQECSLATSDFLLSHCPFCSSRWLACP